MACSDLSRELYLSHLWDFLDLHMLFPAHTPPVPEIQAPHLSSEFQYFNEILQIKQDFELCSHIRLVTQG